MSKDFTEAELREAVRRERYEMQEREEFEYEEEEDEGKDLYSDPVIPDKKKDPKAYEEYLDEYMLPDSDHYNIPNLTPFTDEELEDPEVQRFLAELHRDEKEKRRRKDEEYQFLENKVEVVDEANFEKRRQELERELGEDDEDEPFDPPFRPLHLEPDEFTQEALDSLPYDEMMLTMPEHDEGFGIESALKEFNYLVGFMFVMGTGFGLVQPLIVPIIRGDGLIKTLMAKVPLVRKKKRGIPIEKIRQRLAEEAKMTPKQLLRFRQLGMRKRVLLRNIKRKARLYGRQFPQYGMIFYAGYFFSNAVASQVVALDRDQPSGLQYGLAGFIFSTYYLKYALRYQPRYVRYSLPVVAGAGIGLTINSFATNYLTRFHSHWSLNTDKVKQIRKQMKEFDEKQAKIAELQPYTEQ